MHTVIRTIIAFVIFVVVGIDARFALAAPAASSTPDFGGYAFAESDRIAGTQKVLVGRGLSVETLVKDFQSDYDPTGSAKLTWETIYALNRDIMIPVCSRFVITEQFPQGIFKSLWTGRGKAGEFVWTDGGDIGCPAKLRTAWLVEGTVITIPVKPLATDTRKIAAYDDLDALKRRVAELEKADVVPLAPAVVEPPVVEAKVAEPEARPETPVVAYAAPLLETSKPSWNSPAFDLVLVALAIIAVCLVIGYFRKREHRLIDRLARSEKAREQAEYQRNSSVQQVQRTFDRLDDLTVENISLKRRLAHQAPRREEPLTPRRMLAAAEQDTSHVGQLLHVSMCSYEARSALVVFLRAHGAEARQGEGINTLIERTLEVATAANKPSAHFLDQLTLWADGPERTQPLVISSSEHLMALDKLHGARIKIAPNCFKGLWAVEAMEHDPVIRAKAEELTMCELGEFLDLFHATSATYPTGTSHKISAGTS